MKEIDRNIYSLYEGISNTHFSREIIMYDVLSIIMIFIVVSVGSFLALKYRFSYLKNATSGIKSLYKNSNGAISSFSAMMAVIGGNLGTGNISGIAVALTLGGPGSIFWICIAILISSSIKYFGCVHGIKLIYNKKNATNTSKIGGPMNYIKLAFGSKLSNKLSIIYALSLIIGVLTIGNFVQVNSVLMSLDSFEINPLYIGLTMTFFVGLVLLGGAHTFANVISKVVPIMAIVYIISCIYIINQYSYNLNSAIHSIIYSAFGIDSIFGAGMGFTTYSAIKSGFARGVFASESGLGLESIVHSSVKKQDNENTNEFAANQGIIAVMSSFLVMTICLFTSLVLLVTETWSSGLVSTAACFSAFEIGLPFGIGGLLLSLMLFLFAFTTILTWNFCAEKCFMFLYDKKSIITIWRIIFVSSIPIGSLVSSSLIWEIADLVVPFILIPNTLAILMLETKKVKA